VLPIIDPDDPRLTTYALDEADAETAAAVEEALRGSEALRNAVEEIRSAAQLLTQGLAMESPMALLPEQREAVQVAAHEAETEAGSPRARLQFWLGLAAAAAVVALVTQIPPPPRWPPDWVARIQEAPRPLLPVPTPSPLQAPRRARTRSPRRLSPPPVAQAPLVVDGSVTVEGVVSAPDGSALPGVTVEVQSRATGLTRLASSGPDGRYRIHGVPPGSVEIQATLSGFKTMEYEASRTAGGRIEWNPMLQIGALTEQITVVGEAPAFEAAMSATSAISAVSATRATSALSMSPGTADQQTEAYAFHPDNVFRDVTASPLSTFSADVDTASYSNMRRFLNDDHLPPADAVRIEEMVNYFPYDDAPPSGDEPFAVRVEAGPAPWNPEHRLVRLGLKARQIDLDQRPPCNLVFLIDVSGSMNEPNKLPLVKQSLRLLVEQLTARDRVALVTYAGTSGLVLPSTPGDQKPTLVQAIDDLEPGGSTNGAAGIELAYQTAASGFISGGINRVILATDGDFNVGVTDEGSLVRLIEEKAKSGVLLSVLGFGMGNLKDSTMEMLADKGNGNYAYIDTATEARKHLVEQVGSTLVTVAKDVKLQVEFNPTKVRSYRLIGYEDRLLQPEDFADDKKDAGEMGAGHTVTALYELIPAEEAEEGAPAAEPLTFQEPHTLTAAAFSDELMRLKVRYKDPDGEQSRLLEWPVLDRETPLAKTSADFRFSAAVASFGMLLRHSSFKGNATFDGVIALAQAALGADPSGYRAEFVALVRKAGALERASPSP
jgi:Ca-activated chloride channel family protein